ncbi:MAG: hypothetical protein A3F90_20155 [Deltaproteobacteria bacterium RIFCSPLOWO2_12_FULL_60_19]|nr:MAG: hypothetical protein A3F90_20155 [Deltaproteobacteria bacterium RIFCSPLOWO2_12_FULL_60_19]
MSSTTGSGFPKGKVAQTLRKILYPRLSDHEAEAVVVCLMSHLLIENKINRLLYGWLKQDAPGWKEHEKVSKAERKLWKNIVEINFARKYSLVEPFFAIHFPQEAANVRKINKLRNNMFHGRAIDDATFNGHPISEERTVEELFVAAQAISMRLDKFAEMIDALHANAERLRKRLSELETQKGDRAK